MSERARVRTKKMLLVAAVGVGTVSYVAACGDDSTSGNFVGTSQDGSTSGGDAFIASGNLAPPPADAPSSVPDVFISSGNLMPAMPPPDANSPAPDASVPPSDGSTDAPATAPDASSDAPHDAALDRFIGSGNLVGPLPDAGVD